MRRATEDDVNRNLPHHEDSEEEEGEEDDTVSVASTKFSYFSLNSSQKEKSKKQSRLSNFAYCIQVLQGQIDIVFYIDKVGSINININFDM